MDLASLFFGIFLGIFVFTAIKVVRQTRTIWGRTRSLNNTYLYLIWIEAWANLIYALITFLYLNGDIQASLGFYLISTGLWVVHTQMLLQIVANRVGLIMTTKRKARNLKISLVVIVGCMNLAVSYIWITAHMPSATASQVSLNHIFEIIDKSFFMFINLAVNLYFLYLVRFRLIADGLSKYWRLFNSNVVIVVISTLMDVMLLISLRFPNSYLYVQFAPLAYTVKQHIELEMASLISKVVRSGAAEAGDGWHGSGNHKPNRSHHMTSRVVITGSTAVPMENGFFSKLESDGLDHEANSGSETQLTVYPDQNGIMKTIETTVIVVDHEDGSSERLQTMA